MEIHQQYALVGPTAMWKYGYYPNLRMGRVYLGEYASACDTFEAVAYKTVGNPFMAAWLSIYMSISFLFYGDSERAASNLKEALTEFREITYLGGIYISCFTILFGLTAGRYDQAVELNEEINTST
jgi:hypothetical protein